MTTRSRRGFTAMEFVIAIVFVGVVLAPLLTFVSRIHELNHRLGRQGRMEAWRSFQDQAVAAGIDPGAAPLLSAAMNGAIPLVPTPVVVRSETEAQPGRPRIVTLKAAHGVDVAEERIAAWGFEIGAGADVGPRVTPLSPLVPIVMPMPVVTPSDGTLIATSRLEPAEAGAAYGIDVEAASGAGTTVNLALNHPFASAVGFSAARHRVTAVDLVNGVNGAAWTEFAGNEAAGDRAAQLADGRTRWLVTNTEGRLQIYEPSARALFAYKLDLGAPILLHGDVEEPSGATLAFDYTRYLEVQAGRTRVRIDFSQAVKDVFGTAWASLGLGFTWHFGANAGPFSGNVRSFFSDDALSLWQDQVVVTASAVVPAGAQSGPSAWRFVRNKTELGVPLVATQADDAGFFVPGWIQFTAPAPAAGATVGRLSFENGATVSTGPTLSISVTP